MAQHLSLLPVRMVTLTQLPLLLKAMLIPIYRGDDGATPLYIASQQGRTDTIALLLKANAHPNLQKDDGSTPLYIASQNGHTDTVALLLEANADPNIPETGNWHRQTSLRC